MKSDSKVSRRGFMKSSAMATTALVGAAALPSGCQYPNENSQVALRQFLKATSSPVEGVTGLLFSQVGYEPGWPVRVVLRLPKTNLISGSTICRIFNTNTAFETPLNYWGGLWGAHWWVAEFRNTPEGVYKVEVLEDKRPIYVDEPLEVKANILWDKTINYAAVDMLERRAHFTKVGAGWQDAGALWVESCSQSAMIIALAELLEMVPDKLDDSFRARLEKQITVGCDYLIMTQEKAKELGYADGAFCHDLHGHEHDILPNDANKAVVALAKASRLLSEKYSEKKQAYLLAAEKAFRWLTKEATPLGKYGFHVFQRGLPPETNIPDEWMTRDLVMMCWASLEMWKTTNSKTAQDESVAYATKVMNRQIPKEAAESGFYGHFYELETLKHSESAWVHGIVPSETGVQFGSDLGGFYPNYLLPLIELIRIWPNHQDAPRWKTTLTNFVGGYLKPACLSNPFHLLPLGIFGNEGPIWFCGTFHGSNAIYGFNAALALELADLLDDKSLKDIAYGNLQWIAGLNAGITAKALQKGCVIYSADIPDGIALPASMICHIGNRWAGTWFQTRGVICNGFSMGEQFKYDTAPLKENDGPHSFTDEDWIPHSAAWISGLIRLVNSAPGEA